MKWLPVTPLFPQEDAGVAWLGNLLGFARLRRGGVGIPRGSVGVQPWALSTAHPALMQVQCRSTVFQVEQDC